MNSQPVGTPPPLLIRNARIVDGTAAPAFEGDVLVESGRIAAVSRGPLERDPALASVPDLAARARAAETVDATGLLLTPGFVDVHTHYDGQATWDEMLAPSCWHGVTTLVMGNCGGRLRAGPARPRADADRADGRRRGHSGERRSRRGSTGAGKASPSISRRSPRGAS
jgi:N-acyl-D-aspartate/D-glutamate deacylase